MKTLNLLPKSKQFFSKKSLSLLPLSLSLSLSTNSPPSGELVIGDAATRRRHYHPLYDRWSRHRPQVDLSLSHTNQPATSKNMSVEPFNKYTFLKSQNLLIFFENLVYIILKIYVVLFWWIEFWNTGWWS